MEDLLWIAVGGLGMLLLGAACAWYIDRARMARMKRKLAWAEESRFAAERHAKAADQRLAQVSQGLAAQKQVLAAVPPGARRKYPVLMPVSPPSGLAVQWADTEPIAVEMDAFKPTQPFEPTRI